MIGEGGGTDVAAPVQAVTVLQKRGAVVRSGGGGLGIVMLALLLLPVARAAEPPAPPLTAAHLTVMGSLGSAPQFRTIEEPFWTHQLAADSDGRITADVTPFDQTGLKGVEALQMARLGVISFLTVPLSLISSEDLEANAADLPGLNPSIEAMRANLAAYRSVLVDLYRARYGLETLAIFSYPAQVLFCRDRFESLSDLAGRNIRVASGTQAGLASALGARGIVLPFAGIRRAFANGTIDCSITGILAGNATGLPEEVRYVQDLTINWGLQIVVVNRATWLGLAPDVRDFLARELAALEQRLWDQAGRATVRGLACDKGRGDCVPGVTDGMIPVDAAPGDRAVLDRILRIDILPKWAARCGEDCTAEWNRTIGARMGLIAGAGPS
jgi:TRAP-type C4-dicarboxylate transport system substrate-binding protein